MKLVDKSESSKKPGLATDVDYSEFEKESPALDELSLRHKQLASRKGFTLGIDGATQPTMSNVTPLHPKKDIELEPELPVVPSISIGPLYRAIKKSGSDLVMDHNDEIGQSILNRLPGDATTYDAVAVMLPNQVVKYHPQKSNAFRFHAELFSSFLMASAVELPVTQINSNKDLETGKCELTFLFSGKLVTWRFSESGSTLSAKFLEAATVWLGKKIGGRYVRVFVPGSREGYLFLSNALVYELSAVKGFK